MLTAAIQYLGGREMVNSVIEVTLDHDAVRCVEYPLPADD